MARRISVEIVGDSRSLERAFARSSKAGQKFNRQMSGQFSGTLRATRSLTGALTGLGAGFLGIAGAAALIRAGFSEMAEAQRATAQTAAVLKSTGKAANVTASEVDAMAESLMRLSGVDDEVIQGGENMLLTFRGIRNEVGRGNDIFNQATVAALDMSVALGKSMRQSALQLGKALQDPVKGITALRRAGVVFTDAQQKQIRALVKSGRVLEAQKIILAEVRREFGGSARAAGDTLPGKLNILRESLRNLGGTFATALTPKVTELVDKLNEWLADPENQKRVIDDFTKAVNNLATAFEKAATAIGFFSDTWDKSLVDIAREKGQSLRDRFMEGIGFDPRSMSEAGRDAGAGYTLGFNTAVQEHLDQVNRTVSKLPRTRGQEPPRPRRRGEADRRVTLRNTIFDAAVARQLNRLQDLNLRGQLAGLRALAQTIRARISVTKDATRRLTLEDQLLDVLREQRSVQEQIGDQVRATNQALKDRADAIKSAILERLERRQQDVLNKRALRDAQERLRVARLIGGPLGIRAAREGVQDVRFDILRQRLEAAPARLTRGGQFALGNIITINIHGVTDPNQVAIKVDEILKRRGRRSSNPTRGAAAGSSSGHR